MLRRLLRRWLPPRAQASDRDDEARAAYRALIDSLREANQHELAQQLASMAVSDGLWQSTSQLPLDFNARLGSDGVLPTPSRLASSLQESFPSIAAELSVLGADRSRFGASERRVHCTTGSASRYTISCAPGFDRAGPPLTATRAAFASAIQVESIALWRVVGGTQLRVNFGPTNALARLYLPINVAPHSCLLIDGSRIELRTGLCTAIDDGFEHEFSFSDSGIALLLVVDAPHPRLSPEALAQRKPESEAYLESFLKDRGLTRVVRRAGVVLGEFEPNAEHAIRRRMRDGGASEVHIENGRLRVFAQPDGS